MSHDHAAAFAASLGVRCSGELAAGRVRNASNSETQRGSGRRERGSVSLRFVTFVVRARPGASRDGLDRSTHPEESEDHS